MPELPDVEGFRAYLERTSLDERVDGVRVRDRRALRDVGERALARRLRGRRLQRTLRRGKYLLAAVEDDGWLALHFGMTGGLVRLAPGEAEPRHSRVVLRFADGGALAFVDQRLFGGVGLTEDPEAFFASKDLGPDALEITPDVFDELLASHPGSRLKQLLMDQSLVAGIGNVYSDEILYHAGLHPLVPAALLDAAGRRRLYEVTEGVLRRAVAANTGGAPLPGDWLLHHRRSGAVCPGGGTVERVTVGGRSTYVCPRRQRLR